MKGYDTFNGHSEICFDYLQSYMIDFIHSISILHGRYGMDDEWMGVSIIGSKCLFEKVSCASATNNS